MGLSCSICSREDRDELEHRIVAGDAIRLIARQAGVGRDPPTRHARCNCPGRWPRSASRDLQAVRALDRLEVLFDHRITEAPGLEDRRRRPGPHGSVAADDVPDPGAILGDARP